MRVLYGVTVPISAYSFLTGQLRSLVDAGLDIHVTFSPQDHPPPGAWARAQGANYHPVTISRRPGIGDLAALRDLIRLVREISPDAVVMATPKMGLLGLMASRLAGVPRRIYLVHGLRYEGSSGAPRWFLIAAELAAARCATEVVAVSTSVAAGLGRIGVRAQVLGHGSANGIDSVRFSPPTVEQQVEARTELSLPFDRTVVLFVGRLTADKGLGHLSELARSLQADTGAVLVMVGADETRTAAERSQLRELRNNPAVRFLEHRKDIETVYRAADLLVLPTLREGLPTVVLEAAASGVPCVATRATGVVDAVAQGMTGVIVDREDPAKFVRAVLDLVNDPPRRARLGVAARNLVLQRFTQEQVWAGWLRLLVGSPPDQVMELPAGDQEAVARHG